MREHEHAGTIGLAELAQTGGVAAAIELEAEAALADAGLASERAERREALRRLFIPRLARIDRESKAPQQEAMYKCSCAIDAIADKVDYATWVDLSTIANATTIAGERGGVMRDLKDGRKMIVSYREIQEDAKKRCFLGK